MKINRFQIILSISLAQRMLNFFQSTSTKKNKRKIDVALCEKKTMQNHQNPESASTSKMYVIKRNGDHQSIHFDKILQRLEKLCRMEPALDEKFVDCAEIAQKVITGIYPGVKTSDLDQLASETAAYQSTIHPHYDALAARISVSNLHKQTSGNILDVARTLYYFTNPKNNKQTPLINEMALKFIEKNAARLTEAMDYNRDYNFSIFGFKTLEKSYLLRCNTKIVERPQDLLMRVAVGIHMTCESATSTENEEAVDCCIETYEELSCGKFIHATPTLFNAATNSCQMSSCFLIDMDSDSIDGIYTTLKKCALISKTAGGIGLSVSKIRATDSFIAGTNGKSNGIVPMLKVFNDTARYVDQGGGKRKGSFAIYLEPWHADIFAFLELKKNHGAEELRARDLFYALWVPDLMMKRVESNGQWSLFCPNEAPGLDEVYGEEFEALYTRYEKEGRARKQIPAQLLWRTIVESQIETGTPYIMYKDSCNRKSNQKNLGTIKSGNLCTEIVEYTSSDEIAVCNLASVALPKFVDVENKVFDHDELARIVAIMTRNLNKIIDKNSYPVSETLTSNMKHRPIGLGVQGLADVFIKLSLPFESDGAKLLNREIFETIYFAAVSESCKLAEQHGKAYLSYQGSPMSLGQFQFDLWNELPQSERSGATKRHDWQALRERVKKFGVYNSLLVAPMPTASTSQILGNNECIEPYTSNCYSRRVLAGEFVVMNEHLVYDLIKRGLWTEDVKQDIVRHKGSVQNVKAIPDELKNIYKTVWEISQKNLVDMAADRGIYVDQSQSFNVFFANPTFQQLTSMHFYGWKKGLKTGMYYLRTQAATDAIQFTVNKKEEEGQVCRREAGCVTCSS